MTGYSVASVCIVLYIQYSVVIGLILNNINEVDMLSTADGCIDEVTTTAGLLYCILLIK